MNNYSLGIELGSTRIKAVLINQAHGIVASGSYNWENRLENGVWTYHLDEVWTGVQTAVKELAKQVPLTKVGAIGISAMMHGYLAFDKDKNQLAQFRTWRNTTTEQAAKRLTGQLQFNIPQRWSVAHLYQAVLNNETHVKDIAFLTTLAGYVHWRLTGQKVLGIGDASGMFPIYNKDYNPHMLEQFNALVPALKLKSILPKVLLAGEQGGLLTEEGAKLLDSSGQLSPGIPLCPPEGDAGTGMVATNSVSERTGNVSAGTSIFAMIVLEKGLSKVYPEIDMVTTPAGKPVAMVHCNNCTTDLDAWVKLFGEAAEALGTRIDKSTLYNMLYNKALEGESDGGGLLSYNYYSGEPIVGLEEGRPLLARTPNSRFTLPNLMRTLLFSSIATLRLGMDILSEQEHVKVEQLLGHGGLFKTEGVGQRLMAAALNLPISIMPSAGEGGAWGIALLSAYMLHRAQGEGLESYLTQKVFKDKSNSCVQPKKRDAQGFNIFLDNYKKGLPVEWAAAKYLC